MTDHHNIPLPAETVYTGSYADHILRIALDIGEGLLKNGADVHRVEVAIEKICMAYGVLHVDVFVIQSLILVSVHMSDDTRSVQARQIIETANNLTRLEMYNALSRSICETKLTIEEVDVKIKAIKQESTYPFIINIFAYIVSAFSFAIFFGGTLRDGIAAGLIGILMALLNKIDIDQINRMVKNLMISFAAGTFSCFSVMIGLGENLDMIIIGTIMLLVPGLSLGNAMRDLLSGDTITGTLKTVQAVIIAVMMALGYALALLAFGGGLQ